MRITKVYTRTGDRGDTRLVGGAQVHKDHPRIEAYGTVDELNAILGLARAFLKPSETSGAVTLDGILQHLQNDLFNVGTDLATPAEARWPSMYRVGQTDVDRLEGWCDALNEDLPALKEFILPGGGTVGAFLHQARTVCRRAERRVLTLMHSEDDIGEGSLRYLNRLSDLLFIMSRWAAKLAGEAETFWTQPTS